MSTSVLRRGLTVTLAAVMIGLTLFWIGAFPLAL